MPLGPPKSVSLIIAGSISFEEPGDNMFSLLSAVANCVLGDTPP